MKKKILGLALLVISFSFSAQSIAQVTDTVADICLKHLKEEFISDGQQYRSLLINSGETAEFSTTLFEGTTYRIAACSGLTEGNLLFWVYDNKRNLLFTNKDYQDAPYWDFKIKNSIDCIIEAKLNSNKNYGSGRAVILIGFKK